MMLGGEQESFMLHLLRLRARFHSRLASAIVGTFLSLVLVSLSVAGCGEPAPSAAILLQEAQAHFAAAQSFHVLYLVEEAQHLTQSDLFYLARADGDVERPDKLSATVDALTPGGALSGAKLIVIGGQGWLANPQTGQYERDVDVVQFARFYDPQIGVGTLLTQIKQPTPTQGYKDIWITSGSLPADTLSAMLPQLAGHIDPVRIQVDVSQSDHQFVGLNLTGMLFPGESSPYSHLFSFSRFGAPVRIQPPTSS
jgi:hypothetical protein